jgi:hypothetical protein
MEPLGSVAPFDGVGTVSHGVLPGGVHGTVDTFVLESSENDSTIAIIVTYSGTAHGLADTEGFQRTTELLGGIGAPPVRVKDPPGVAGQGCVRSSREQLR